MPQLTWTGGHTELAALRPPTPLREGFRACLELRAATADGALVRTRQGVRDWIENAPNERQRRVRRRTVTLAQDFLDGERLEDAERVLQTRYHAYLAADPKAQAQRFVALAAMGADGARLEAEDDDDALVAASWPGWLAAAG